MNEADLRTCHMREAMHGHGDGFFFYEHECIEHPRLRRFDRYDKKTRSVTSTWRVDGEDVADLAAAADRLARPPTITDAERVTLATVPDEWSDLRSRFVELWSLRLKGLIECQGRLSRRSPLAAECKARSEIEGGRSDG